MMYIVTWILVEIFIVNCDHSKQMYDEYGRHTGNNMTMYDELCYKAKETHYEKVFYDREKAVLFIKYAPAKDFGVTSYSKNVVLDSCDEAVKDCSANRLR